MKPYYSPERDELEGEGHWECSVCGYSNWDHQDLHHIASACFYQPAWVDASGSAS